MICRQCGTNQVERDREDWATPVCKGCLPDCRHAYCSRQNNGRTRLPTQRGYGRCEIDHEKMMERGQ